MKVYVVVGGWDYEGYSEPTGVYSTKEKADAAKQHARSNHSYDNLEIMEYDLDIGEAEGADDQWRIKARAKESSSS